MAETVLMRAEGQQDVLELLVNKVRIKSQNHEFEIFLDRISAILFVHASGILPGSLEFFFSGAGLLEHKFNHIIFTREQQPQFERIRTGIENLIFQSE